MKLKLRTLRRALHVGGGLVIAALACAAVGAGLLERAVIDDGGPAAIGAGHAAGTPALPPVLLAVAVAALVLAATARRMRFRAASARAQRVSWWLRAAPGLADAEISLAMIAGVHVVIATTGGLASPAYPLLYAVVAFAATFQGRAGASAAVGAAVLLEIATLVRLAAADGEIAQRAVVAAALHLAFLVGAAIVHAVFLRGIVVRQRHLRARRIEDEILDQRERARDYRLIASALGAESRAPRSRGDEELMLASGGAQVIGQTVFFTLSLVERALAARTVVLLWLDELGTGLKVKEVVSDSDRILAEGRVAAAGVIGAMLRDRAPLLLAQTRPGQLPYYDGGDVVGAFAGVPVSEGGHLRGLLCADRGSDRPFDDRDRELLANAADQIVRAVQAEHVFRAVERSKYEHERFYHASSMLCRALTLEQVTETAFEAAAQIIDYDAAAIALYDRESKSHRVASVRVNPGAEHLLRADSLAGLEFRDNAGLASMVVKNRHYLPAGGEVRDLSAPVFTKKIKLHGESLLVLPLLSGDEAIGTFTLTSRHKLRFGKDVREMLSIIANQVAVSLQNGLMYRKMEHMATTDGLTGLTNHRTFQDRFADLLERAGRHNYKAAMLLCDVDHFKKVNDTYGHPVGDEVLRRVARVLQDVARKIDITARYGGEEFAVVLEATDLEGAISVAERIRQEVGKMQLESDKGPFQVTMSLGVSTFPDDSRDRAALIERADHALYHAKETGRNRVVSYQAFNAARKARRAG